MLACYEAPRSFPVFLRNARTACHEFDREQTKVTETAEIGFGCYRYAERCAELNFASAVVGGIYLAVLF